MINSEGKFDTEATMRQIASLPEPRKEPTKAAMEHCQKFTGMFIFISTKLVFPCKVRYEMFE